MNIYQCFLSYSIDKTEEIAQLMLNIPSDNGSHRYLLSHTYTTDKYCVWLLA